VRQLNDVRLLWVDDRPENNVFERRALEALGIRITLSTTTEDALNKTLHSRYDVLSQTWEGHRIRGPDIRCSMLYASEATRLPS